MYEFAVVVLLGLATLKVVDLLAETVPAISRFRSLVTMAIAVIAVAALDYSVFAGLGVEVRDAWYGSLFTGLIVGSVAHVWAALIGWLGSNGSSVGTTVIRTGERPRAAA